MTLWFMADPHFSHKALIRKTIADRRTCPAGEQQCDEECKSAHPRLPLRPFSSPEEMNETIVSRWNELVRPRDHGYLIGDVAMKKSHLSILDRLNGHLRLVGGNHDIFTVADYRKYFNKIYGVRVFDDLLITHVPVHPTCLGKRFIVNVHGHIHARRLPGPYIGISVEQTDYRPLSLEDLRTRAEAFK